MFTVPSTLPDAFWPVTNLDASPQEKYELKQEEFWTCVSDVIAAEVVIGKNPDLAAERESAVCDLVLDQDLGTDTEAEVEAELGAEAGKCELPHKLGGNGLNALWSIK